MLKKKQVILMVGITLMSLLIGTLFNMNYVVKAGDGSPWDKVWTAISELQTKVDGLNATLTSRIEDVEGQIAVLQTDIATLQTQIVEMNASLVSVEGYVETMLAGYVNPPAYDSGWLQIDRLQVITLTHNLGTTDLFVYMIGKTSSGKIHQSFYGGARLWDSWVGVRWYDLTATTISVTRLSADGFTGHPPWDYIRVMVWRIL